MQEKLIITLERLSEPYFVDKAQLIVKRLTTEPLLTRIPDPWPSSLPSRPELVTALKEYLDALQLAGDRARSAITTRKMKRLVLTKMFKKLAPYLESVAEKADDASLLTMTGYDPRHPIVHTQLLEPLDAPELDVRWGILSGTILGRVKRMRGAVAYEGQYMIWGGSAPNEADWKNGVLSAQVSQMLFTGLTPGQRYVFRVRAIGRRGPGAWSMARFLMAV